MRKNTTRLAGVIAGATLFIILMGGSALANTEGINPDISDISKKGRAITESSKKMKELFGSQEGLIDNIEFDERLNMYRVEIRGRFLLITPDMKYMLTGDVIDMETKKSLFYAPKTVNYSALPFDSAVKIGSGPKEIAVFSSLSCPYCKTLLRELSQRKDVTAHVFLSPEPASGEVWCAKDRAKAMTDMLTAGKPFVPISNEIKCDIAPLAKNQELARTYHIRSVPTIIFKDGDNHTGYIAMEQLTQMLSKKGYK